MISVTIISNDSYYFESAKWLIESAINMMARGEEYCFFFDNDVKLGQEVIVFRLPCSSYSPILKMDVNLEDYEEKAAFTQRSIRVTIYKRKAE